MYGTHRERVPARAGARAARLTLLVVLALAAAALAAVPAGAKIVTPSGTTKKVSFLPSITAAKKFAGMSCTTSCVAMTWHGGPVQHAEKEYLFFWTPSGHGVPSAYRSGMGTWLSETAAADYTPGDQYSVLQQYYDQSGSGGTKRFVPYNLSNGGTIVDTAAFPASGCTDHDGSGKLVPVCLTQAQLQTELQRYIAAHSLPTGLGVQYFIMTGPGVGSCFSSGSTSCSYTQYCAWHTYGGTTSAPVLYADMPWAYNVSGCDVNLAFGTGYPNADAIDPEVGVFSHELSETATDPQLNAWYDSSGNEIGDKCAYTYGSGGYGSMTGLSNNGLGYWNIAFASDQYLMQLEFGNQGANCFLKDTDSQPSATLSPNTATHGVAQTFTAAVTAANGLAYIDWSFGDGTPVVETTTNSVSHTYATTGTKTMTAIVTDGHGNEKKVTLAVTVS